MKKELLRSEQKKENTWDLESIYPSMKEYKKEYDMVYQWMQEISKYQNHILDSSKSLLETLELDQTIERTINKLATYTYRKYDEDLSNVQSQELKGKFDNLYTEYSKNGSFIVPEILTEDFSLIQKYIEEDPKLK